MATTDFRPDVHGFPFPNRFVNEVARLPNGDRIRTSGRCGGMSAAALDIYYADRTAPRFDWKTFPRGVPPDATPIATYLYKRQLQSFENASAVRFIAWTLMPSQRHFLFKGVDNWTAEEVKDICRAIDAGRPAVIGLVGASSLGEVGRKNHQAVAFGYQRSSGSVRLDIYDCNTPNRTVALTWTKGESGLPASNRKVPWRGCFLHAYDLSEPPESLWDEPGHRSESRRPVPAGQDPMA